MHLLAATGISATSEFPNFIGPAVALCDTLSLRLGRSCAEPGGGYTLEIICQYCGKSSHKRTGLVNRAKKAGLKMYCDMRCANLAKLSGNDQVIAVMYALPEGTTYSISKEFGVCSETVRNALMRMGIPLKSRSYRVPCSTPTWDEFFIHRTMPIIGTGCIVWMDAWDDAGYGHLHSKWTSEVRAHRASWFFANGKIPDGMNVLHRCDVRCCVNPNHLFLGTQRENVIDMFAKGRQGDHRGKSTRGEHHPNAVLNDILVREIRRVIMARECSQNQLAKKLGVSPITISRVVNRALWSHVDD